MANANSSTMTVGKKVQEFVGCCDEAFLSKDLRGVITSIMEIPKLQVLYAAVQKAASQELFNRQGERRTLREAALVDKYDFEVVCIDSHAGEWLAMGIQTPLGIIPYEL